MKLFICCFAAVLLLVSSVTASKIAVKHSKESVKGKRELPPGSYSGASYKYLPPVPVSIGGGGAGGYSGGYSSGSTAALDFGHGGGGYSGGAGSDLGHGNVETYIVQSSGGKGSSFGGGSFGESASLGGGAGSFKYSGGGFSGGSGGLGFGGGHKVQTVVIPSQSYGSPGLSYSNSNSFSGGHSSSSSFGGSSYSSGAGNAPSVSYGAPSSSYSGGGLSLGGSSSHGSSGISFGGASSHGGSGLSFGGASSHGGSSLGGGGGGSYYTTKLSAIPSSSYGIPLASPLSSYSPKYSGSSFGPVGGSSGPTYAAGQKGLGHFSYSSSKPSALHTDFISSSSLGGGIGGGFGGIGGHGKAPFKPSAFLGSSQDSGASYPGNDYLPPSQEYLPVSHSFGGSSASSGGSGYQVPATVYGAPGGGSQSIYEQAAPIHEPSSFGGSDDNYVAPQQSYGVPSAPGKSYPPPSSSYGLPNQH